MTYQAHDCDTVAVRTGTRCPGCGAHVVHCALCGDELTDHLLDPCRAV